MIRPAAVAGTWYPRSPQELGGAIDAFVEDAAGMHGSVVALVAPHAGLKYSGPVAAHAYRLLAGRSFETIVMVGPSHFVSYHGVAAFPAGAFDTPLGQAGIDAELTAAIAAAARGLVFENGEPHAREHSLEMQLPFIQRLAPSARIVPLLMGEQTATTSRRLAEALAEAVSSRSGVLLVASSDLSHYHDAATALRLDSIVLETLSRFDPEGLQRALDANRDHACGGGPMVAVVSAAKQLGARDGRVLRYADSGDVSGDKSSVVGYAAAAFGTFVDGGAADRA